MLVHRIAKRKADLMGAQHLHNFNRGNSSLKRPRIGRLYVFSPLYLCNLQSTDGPAITEEIGRPTVRIVT